MVNVAVPVESRVLAPSILLPSLKVMLPVGTMPLFEATVAVKVTVCRRADGFTEETRVTDVPEMTWRVVGKPRDCRSVVE